MKLLFQFHSLTTVLSPTITHTFVVDHLSAYPVRGHHRIDMPDAHPSSRLPLHTATTLSPGDRRSERDQSSPLSLATGWRSAQAPPFPNNSTTGSSNPAIPKGMLRVRKMDGSSGWEHLDCRTSFYDRVTEHVTYQKLSPGLVNATGWPHQCSDIWIYADIVPDQHTAHVV